MLKRTPNDLGESKVERPIGDYDHAVICIGLSLQRPIFSDKYGRNFSGMNRRRPMDLSLPTQSELEKGSN